MWKTTKIGYMVLRPRFEAGIYRIGETSVNEYAASFGNIFRAN